MTAPRTAPDLAAALRTALDAAREAASFVQEARHRIGEVAVTTKQAGDVASDIDREAEALIRRRIAADWPAHGFLGEESGGTALQGDAPCWIVDPIDGTANYLRGYPQYAVSIALAMSGEPVVGVIADPCRGEVFAAARGQGAWLDGQRLQCAPPRPPIEALAGTVFPKPASPRLPDYLDGFGRVLRAFGGVRRSGAMTLELACLAAGRIDAFWAHDMGPWDAAAAMVLVAEAGALFTPLDGHTWMHSRAVMACTPTLHDTMIRLLSPGAPA